MLKCALLFWLRFSLLLSIMIPLNSCRESGSIPPIEPPSHSDRALLGYQGEPLFIRIIKQDKQFEVFVRRQNRYQLFRSYPICAFSGGIGPKKKEGDRKTPEGFYGISRTSLNPASRYHLSMNIGYPNSYDRQKGYTGSFIMIHGDCVSVGCIAMTNPLIEEIYTLVEKALDNGQGRIPVHIFPFHMTPQNLNVLTNSEHIDFWQNLASGYQRFIQEDEVIDPYAPRASGFIKTYERRLP